MENSCVLWQSEVQKHLEKRCALQRHAPGSRSYSQPLQSRNASVAQLIAEFRSQWHHHLGPSLRHMCSSEHSFYFILFILAVDKLCPKHKIYKKPGFQGAWETAQPVKCLPPGHESSLSLHIEIWG